MRKRERVCPSVLLPAVWCVGMDRMRVQPVDGVLLSLAPWVCPRHAWMCSRPAPFTEKAIFPPLDCFAPLLEVKRAYLYESMSGFCAMGWRWTGMEGGTQDARSNPGKMGESSGEAASWCTEDIFWRQLQISVIHMRG